VAAARRVRRTLKKGATRFPNFLRIRYIGEVFGETSSAWWPLLPRHFLDSHCRYACGDPMPRNICSSCVCLFETRCGPDISAVRHGVRLSDEIAEYFPPILLEVIVRKNRLLRKTRTQSRTVSTVIISLLLAAPAFAQANSPWENAVSVLQQAFTSTIARGLSLVAIVVSGLTFAFGPSKPTSVILSTWSSISSADPVVDISLKSSKSTATTPLPTSSTFARFSKRRKPKDDNA